MTRRAVQLLLGMLFIGSFRVAFAQLPPEIGFAHPAGGKAGSTFEVVLGGYDWMPDMQIFAHDPRIEIELIGPPSPVLVPEPPYWFGAKGRGPAWPLCREFPARVTIPADVAPGIVRWQVANANGASPAGFLQVGTGADVVEDARRTAPQVLPELPVTVSGQIRRIEEVDEYEFRVAKPGLVRIELIARRLGSPLHAMVRVREKLDDRRVVFDSADTEGRDLNESFVVQADKPYILSLHDHDFAGDRSYVYRIALRQGPLVLAAYPAAGRRGETQRVEFVGVGVATGGDQLESAIRDVSFAAGADANSFSYTLQTPAGNAQPFSLLLSDVPEKSTTAESTASAPFAPPFAITSFVETRFGSKRHLVAFRKGDKLRISAQATAIGSPLDLALSIHGPDGKELMYQDDRPGSTDPTVELVGPLDGDFQITVMDRSGKSGTRAAAYRLMVEPQRDGFSTSAAIPDRLAITLGEKAKMAVQLVRHGDFKEAVQLSLLGLPVGVTGPAEMTVPAGKNDLSLELTCAADAPANAALCELTAATNLNGQPITRSLGMVLVATVMKPRIKISPEGLDDVRKVHRGTTYLAPLNIERLEGFPSTGEITLEMTSKQQRHRQGLASGEFIVPPGAQRVEYPIFVPEWMETTKTSRMILNGVVKVADPRGNVRSLVQKMELRIGILPEGALLKLAHQAGELTVVPGAEVHIPLTLSRATELNEPITIELVTSGIDHPIVTAEPVTLAMDQTTAQFPVRIVADPGKTGERTFTIRATARHAGWPVQSETTVTVEMIRP